MLNTGNLAVATVQTPDGEVRYDGSSAIAGVPGTAAAIQIDFLDTPVRCANRCCRAARA